MKYGLMEEGFYVIKNGYQYRAIKSSNDWHKCSLCVFQYNQECTAGNDIKKVCDVLEDNYWISVNNLKNNDDYIWERSYHNIDLTINNNLYL